jgi:hypothetical protein
MRLASRFDDGADYHATLSPRNADTKDAIKDKVLFAKMDSHRGELIGITVCIVSNFRVAYRMRWRHIVAQDPQSFALVM